MAGSFRLALRERERERYVQYVCLVDNEVLHILKYVDVQFEVYICLQDGPHTVLACCHRPIYHFYTVNPLRVIIMN